MTVTEERVRKEALKCPSLLRDCVRLLDAERAVHDLSKQTIREQCAKIVDDFIVEFEAAAEPTKTTRSVIKALKAIAAAIRSGK